MQELKQLIEELGADPYEILKTQPTSDMQTLRKNYRLLAIKYHPDKNKDQQAKLTFLKVNQAYEYLKTYQSYIRVLQQQKKRNEGMDEKRRKLAEDLKRREQDHKKTQEDIEKELKRRKEFFAKKMEEAEQRESVRVEVMQGIGVKKYYELVSSFDVNWRQGLSFTENMLRMSFAKYGKVQQIKLQPKRNRATITLNSIEDCTKLVKQFKHPQISLKYSLQPNKRQHLLKALTKQKHQQLDLSLSSENIERFKQIMNRGGGLYRPDYRTDF